MPPTETPDEESTSICDRANDFSWDLLEKLRLADFFDDHDIPPIFFLLLLLAILILLIYFLVFAPAGGEPTLESCGDGRNRRCSLFRPAVHCRLRSGRHNRQH